MPKLARRRSLDASKRRSTGNRMLSEEDRHFGLVQPPGGDALDELVERGRFCVEPPAVQSEEDERGDQ